MASDPRPVTPSLPALLAGLSAVERETMELRIERWRDDLEGALTSLYPEHDVQALIDGLLARAVTGFAKRDPELRRLDQRRILRPDWLQHPDMFGYACYADRFAGTLARLPEHLDHLRDLGVTYLHLMPLLQPREGDNDGGYAVQDYRTVRPDLGTVDDLRALTKTLRGERISLVLDLVLNHVAREHDWAERARRGERHYRSYFHISPTGPPLTPTSARCRRTFPTSRRATSPGTTSCSRGSGPPSTSGSGTSTGLEGIAHLARVRAQLHAGAYVRLVADTDPGVLAVIREHPSGPMVCLYNVTDTWRSFDYRHFSEAGIGSPHNALGGRSVFGDGVVALSPYAAWWVVDDGPP